MNTRRAPNRSPSEPPIRISELSVTRYAFAVHCCPASPPPRSSAMAGSATFTTVESTVTTVVPRIAATSVSCLVLEEGVPVLPTLVGELCYRDHPVVVVALDLVERECHARGRAPAERVADVALLPGRLHPVLLEVGGHPREHRDLRVDVGHCRREPLLVELARGDPL